MTDNTNESALGAAGGSSPNEQAANPNGQQSSSGDAALQQRLEELTNTVKGLSKELDTFKSGKDRGVNETKKELAAMKASVGEIERLMKERGVGVGEALDIIEGSKAEDEFRQSVRELVQHLRGSNSLPNGNGAVDVAKVIAETGLSAQDPEVIAAFAGKNFSNPLEAQVAAWKLAAQKATKPQPSDADAPSAPSKPAAPKNKDAVLAELIELQRNPSSKNETRRKELLKLLEG
jgi:hypothetical protein